MTVNASVQFRSAQESDLQAIVRLLADDPLGSQREFLENPLPQAYYDALASIESDPNNEIIVAIARNSLVGVLQLTFIPSLTYQGRWRAQIEGVRVAGSLRSRGVGRALFQQAFKRARERACCMVQLTTDKTRPDAVGFYERLGFKATHEGLKLLFATHR